VSLLKQIAEDVRAVRERDPAAHSTAEVLLCYSGLHATIAHRINHRLWRAGFRLAARFNSQVAKFFTGVEIHPGARIGRRFFIDHGTGTVIGETTEIGDGCSLLQGVTLGGTGKETGKRHPTLCDDVTVGAHAQVLGSITIGRGAVIGAAAVVVDPVPEYCTVVGQKATVNAMLRQPIGPYADLWDVFFQRLGATQGAAMRDWVLNTFYGKDLARNMTYWTTYPEMSAIMAEHVNRIFSSGAPAGNEMISAAQRMRALIK